MAHHEKTTFFSNIKNIPVADLKQQDGQVEQPVRNPKPRWLIPLAITVLAVQIIGLVLWYGHKERIKAKSSLNGTIAKLKVVEKHGYNIKGFYADVMEQDKRLHSFTSMLLPFIVHDVNAQVAEVDSKISLQYSSILEEEKLKLVQKLEQINLVLNKTRMYQFESKQEVYDYYLELQEKINSSAVTISQVSVYMEELTKKEELLRKDLHEVLNKRFGELEKDYSVAVNYNYPSRERIAQYIEIYGSTTKTGKPTLQEVITHLELVENNVKVIAKEVEEQRKEVVFNNIETTTQEVDLLLAFFSQRSGYINEINQLNQYKNAVTQYTREKFQNHTSDALRQQAEKELFTKLAQPRQSKLLVEEKEKAELLAKQKAMAAEAGIPVPPIDAPKLILIDVTKQRMYAYENGISIFDQAVPVTTGMSGFDTVKGKFAIYSKYSPFRMRSPFPGIEYDNMVDFVMFFYQGYGIHDASWRSVYGTMDYPSVGSHGCVNTPYAYIQRLYEWAEIGTTVLVI